MSAQRIALALLAALGLGSFQAASAQGTDGGLRLRPLLGIGYSWGGDTITPVTVSNTADKKVLYETDIDAGEGLDLRVGVDISRAGSPLSLQLALAYHVDGFIGATDAAGEFRRIPAEAVLRWQASERVHVGFGVRKALYAAVRANDASCPVNTCGGGGRIRYRSSVGLVLETEYALSPDWGLRARYVRESYKVSKSDPDLSDTVADGWVGEKVRADHIGLMSVWYFR